MSSLVCILKPAKEDFAFTRVKSEIEMMKKDIEFKKDREDMDEIRRGYLNSLENLAKLRKNCITRYSDYLDDTDESLEN